MGLVNFTEIRPACTEITLAVHYDIKNKLFAWLDRRLHFVDAFVNSELRSIRAHFEGIAAPYVEHSRSCRSLRPRYYRTGEQYRPRAADRMKSSRTIEEHAGREQSGDACSFLFKSACPAGGRRICERGRECAAGSCVCGRPMQVERAHAIQLWRLTRSVPLPDPRLGSLRSAYWTPVTVLPISATYCTRTACVLSNRRTWPGRNATVAFGSVIFSPSS